MQVLNMTNLFKKEMLLYSLSDVRFKKPVKIMSIVYFVLTFLMFSVPFMKIFGLPTSPMKLLPVLVVPFLLSTFMSKPIFNGRSFFAAVRVYTKFWVGSKIYYDMKSSKPLKNYIIYDNKLVSRKKDYQKVMKLQYPDSVIYD